MVKFCADQLYSLEDVKKAYVASEKRRLFMTAPRLPLSPYCVKFSEEWKIPALYTLNFIRLTCAQVEAVDSLEKSFCSRA